MIRLSEFKNALLHLFFPHICAGCGTDLLDIKTQLCLHCIHDLPETNFERFENNPVEKLFAGRLPLISATACYYFTKDSLVQRLLHELKYKGNKDLGRQLGRFMATRLIQQERFCADVLIPLPLFPGKEKKRGYNQSLLICQGMQEVMNIPIIENVITRPEHTESQTRKGRIERWKNIEGKFLLSRPAVLEGKHVLLVDDVITTGATLESCGEELIKARDLRLSIASLCISMR